MKNSGDIFVKKSKDIHGEKYEYCQVEYSNAHTKVAIICHNHGVFWQTPHGHLKGYGCRKCAYLFSQKNRRCDFNEIKNYFATQKCVLLETEYKNVTTPLRYKCPYGHETKTTWSSFKKGIRCRECFKQSMTGENSHRWIKDREKLKNIKIFRTKCHSLLRASLKSTNLDNLNYRKEGKIRLLFGYTPFELQQSIMSDQNWDKLKNEKWHIDHIFPIKAFVDYNIKDLKIINALDNLRPLSALENFLKNDTYNAEEFMTWIKKKMVSSDPMAA